MEWQLQTAGTTLNFVKVNLKGIGLLLLSKESTWGSYNDGNPTNLDKA
jgi:hypothetical protein